MHTATSKSILLAGLFAIITAEFSFAQNTPTPTPTATVEPDPVKSFKELVASFPTRSVGKTSDSTPYSLDIMDVTFDVKKTDSLMNPVIGIINFTTKSTSSFTSKLPSSTRYTKLQMVFHWQGDHWKFERLLIRENGADATRSAMDGKWRGAMSDFLKSVQ